MKKGEILKRITKKGASVFRWMAKHWIGVLAIVGAIAIVLFIASIFIPKTNPLIAEENTVTKSSLTDAISTSKLTSAEFIYNGIVSKYKEGNENPEYSIAYKSICKSGVSINEISFEVDNRERIVYPHFPDPVIQEVNVDIGSISYMPENPNIEMSEVVKLCEDDVWQSASSSEEFKRVAKENLKDAIKALTKPLLDKNHYTIAWSN